MATKVQSVITNNQMRALMAYIDAHDALSINLERLPSSLCKYHNCGKCKIDDSDCPVLSVGCSHFILKGIRRDGTAV